MKKWKKNRGAPAWEALAVLDARGLSMDSDNLGAPRGLRYPDGSARFGVAPFPRLSPNEQKAVDIVKRLGENALQALQVEVCNLSGALERANREVLEQDAIIENMARLCSVHEALYIDTYVRCQVPFEIKPAWKGKRK